MHRAENHVGSLGVHIGQQSLVVGQWCIQDTKTWWYCRGIHRTPNPVCLCRCHHTLNACYGYMYTPDIIPRIQAICTHGATYNGCTLGVHIWKHTLDIVYRYTQGNMQWIQFRGTHRATYPGYSVKVHIRKHTLDVSMWYTQVNMPWIQFRGTHKATYPGCQYVVHIGQHTLDVVQRYT